MGVIAVTTAKPTDIESEVRWANKIVKALNKLEKIENGRR